MRLFSEIPEKLQKEISAKYVDGVIDFQEIAETYGIDVESFEKHLYQKLHVSGSVFFGEPAEKKPTIFERLKNSFWFDHAIKLALCLFIALFFQLSGTYISHIFNPLEGFSILSIFEALSKLFWGIWVIDTFLFLSNDVTIRYLNPKLYSEKDYTHEVGNGSITPYQRCLLHLLKYLSYLLFYCLLNLSTLKGLATGL